MATNRLERKARRATSSGPTNVRNGWDFGSRSDTHRLDKNEMMFVTLEKRLRQLRLSSGQWETASAATRPQEECFVRSVVLDAHDLG